MSTPLIRHESHDITPAIQDQIKHGNRVRELGGEAYLFALREEHWADAQGTVSGTRQEEEYPFTLEGLQGSKAVDEAVDDVQAVPTKPEPAPDQTKTGSGRAVVGSRKIPYSPNASAAPQSLTPTGRNYGGEGRSAASAWALYNKDHASRR
jgi:hypothetical protein